MEFGYVPLEGGEGGRHCISWTQTDSPTYPGALWVSGLQAQLDAFLGLSSHCFPAPIC